MRPEIDSESLASSLRNGRGLALTLDNQPSQRSLLTEALASALTAPSEYAEISGFGLLYAKTVLHHNLSVKELGELLEGSNFLSSSLILKMLTLLAKNGDTQSKGIVFHYIKEGPFWEVAFNQSCRSTLPGIEDLEDVIAQRLLEEEECPPLGLRTPLSTPQHASPTPSPYSRLKTKPSPQPVITMTSEGAPCSKVYYGEASKAAAYLWNAPAHEALDWARRFQNDDSDRRTLAKNLLLSLATPEDAEFLKLVVSNTCKPDPSYPFETSWCDAADALSRLVTLGLPLNQDLARSTWELSPYPYARQLALSYLDARQKASLTFEGVHDGDLDIREVFIKEATPIRLSPQIRASLKSPLEPLWVKKLMP